MIKLNTKNKHALRRNISCGILLAFFVNMVLAPISPAFAQGAVLPLLAGLATDGLGIPFDIAARSSVSFQPPVLLGLKIHPENPLLFDFIVDQGQSKLSTQELKEETTKLVKYFLAALTIPDKEVWVNLSPTEKDRIIPDVLGQTTMGKTMLEQDYVLKQLAASLTNPETELGKKYWDQVNGSTNHQRLITNPQPLATNNFNKVWIMPERAEVLESNGIVLVGEKRLKVMMAEDYDAQMSSLRKQGSTFDNQEKLDSRFRGNDNISSQIFRSTILPTIEKAVNEGKEFADVRQIYNSVILAAWYKKALKESLLGKIYTDKGKVAGVETDDKAMKQRIYEQYLAAFKKGAYNLIKEEADESGELIPRKYFSGGLSVVPKLVVRPISSSAINENLQASSNIIDVQVLVNDTPKSTSSPIRIRKVDTTDDVVEKLKARLSAPLELGKNWLRIVATPEQALGFHKDWVSDDTSSVEVIISNSRYAFSGSSLRKASQWFNQNRDFERLGYFLVKKDSPDKFTILDFIPVASIALDPRSLSIREENVTQTNMPISLFFSDPKIAEQMGIDINMLKELSFLSISSDRVGLSTIPVHSHHMTSNYSDGPSDTDQSIADGIVNAVFLIRNQKMILYDGNFSKEIPAAASSALTSAELTVKIDQWYDKFFAPAGMQQTFKETPLEILQSIGKNLEALQLKLDEIKNSRSPDSDGISGVEKEIAKNKQLFVEVLTIAKDEIYLFDWQKIEHLLDIKPRTETVNNFIKLRRGDFNDVPIGIFKEVARVLPGVLIRRDAKQYWPATVGRRFMGEQMVHATVARPISATGLRPMTQQQSEYYKGFYADFVSKFIRILRAKLANAEDYGSNRRSFTQAKLINDSGVPYSKINSIAKFHDDKKTEVTIIYGWELAGLAKVLGVEVSDLWNPNDLRILNFQTASSGANNDVNDVELSIEGNFVPDDVLGAYGLSGTIVSQSQFLTGVGSQFRPVLIKNNQGKKYVVRQMSRKFDLKQMKDIVLFVLRLKTKGLPVPALMNKDGKLSGQADDFLFQSSDGGYYIVEEFMALGKSIPQEQLQADNFKALGELAARINNAVADFSLQGESRFISTEQLVKDLKNVFQTISRSHAVTSTDQHQVQRGLFNDYYDFFIEQLTIFINRYKEDGLPRSVIAGDLQPGNMKFGNSGTSIEAFIDFDRVREDFRASEFNNLVMGRDSIDKSIPYSRSKLLLLLKSYQAEVNQKLTPQEIRYIIERIRLRFLEEMKLRFYSDSQRLSVNVFDNPKLLSSTTESIEKFKEFTQEFDKEENVDALITEVNVASSTTAVGGIDFDPTNMNLQIKRDGRGIPLPLPEQNLEQINIQGLFPVIINITPINAQTLPIFLGQVPKEPAKEIEQVSGTFNS